MIEDETGEWFNPGAGGYPGRTCPDCGHLKGLHHVANRRGGGCPKPCRCTLVYFTFGQTIARLGATLYEPGATLVITDVPACRRCGRVGHVAQADSIDPDQPAGKNCRIAMGQQRGELSPPRALAKLSPDGSS